MNRSTHAILFDLDGTLLDSFGCHYRAYEATLLRFGIKINKERFLETYSPDWYQTYRAFGLREDTWPEANQCWLDEAKRQQPHLFPRVQPTLARLRDRARLAIVTSGSKGRVLDDLARNDLTSMFDVVITGDDITAPKPAPEGLEKVLSLLGVDRRNAMYVGDARADYEMALAAGVRFIGIESEFMNLGDCDTLRIRSIEELLTLT